MKKDDLNILLSNDDGINAPGLAALYHEIRKLGKVTIVAPDSEKSAVGHGITLSDPLRVWEVNKNGKLFGYAVNGTPADCVKIAHWALLDEKPDLSVGVTGISNYNGAASFSYTVTANGQVSNVATATLTITPVNDPPVADNITPDAFNEDTESTIQNNPIPDLTTPPPSHFGDD